MRWRVLAGRFGQATLQIVLCAISSYLAWWLAEGMVPAGNRWIDWLSLAALLVPLRALAFLPFGVYSGLWRYASVRELSAIVGAVATGSALAWIAARQLTVFDRIPAGFFGIDALALVFLLGSVRVVSRVPGERRSGQPRRRVLVYGAGDAAAMILYEMAYRSDSPYTAVGIIDDDVAKHDLWIHGAKVLGGRSDLDAVVAAVAPEEILIAMPSASLSTLRSLVTALQPYKIPIKTLPGIRELPECHVEIAQIRPLALEDLLTRPVLGLDPAPLERLLRGRRVLVTGAGGSIGSELCRQILRHQPHTLVLLERHENALFWLTRELEGIGLNSTRLVPSLADVTNETQLEQVLAASSPHIVFHAAAHKHVPMLEFNICEAIRNNVLGTLTAVRTAERYGVDRFVLVSSDKAVNPESVMGATKRACELIVQVLMAKSTTRFCAVRFGNVLGSNGSVTQVFLRQIQRGGPVTVTHPDMRRYFMLISEAVELVQHAAALAEPGTVYVLEMGDPIRIADMAAQLITLAGYRPGIDIPIQFTGIRPGERLHEELVGPNELGERAAAEGLLTVRPVVLPGVDSLSKRLAVLEELVRQGEASRAAERLFDLVDDAGVDGHESLTA
jgi:FlaA1/EpsC-like NDP-sugar epimerase